MITYEEFKKEIERISKKYISDLEVVFEDIRIVVFHNGETVAVIDKYETYRLDTTFPRFNTLGNSLKYELFVVCCELAQTPIPKREQKKRFYIKHKFLYKNTDTGYVNIDIHGYMILADKEEGLSMRTKFTQKEIDEIKEKYNTDLKDFEIIEVGKWPIKNLKGKSKW